MTRHFEYLRPESIEAAIDMKVEHGSRGRFWAGGTDMMLLWQRRAVDFDYCIDLTYIKALRFIEMDSSALRIGSMATLDDLDLKSGLNSALAVLGETARLMNTKQTRTIATVGGNLCHASPSADLTPPLIAMGTQVRLLGSEGERVIPLEEFHTNVNQTVLTDGEMVTEFLVPRVNEKLAASYNRIARTVVDIALVSSAVCLRLDDARTVQYAGVALGAVGPTAIRAIDAEKTLTGLPLEELANGSVQIAGEQASMAARAISDIRASQEFRTDMASVMTQRSISRCIEILEDI